MHALDRTWLVLLTCLILRGTGSHVCQAQVALDGTLGVGGSLTGPAYQITADLGRQLGPNLFHSFREFNLANGESATFSGPNDVHNILARVTGGSASSIDGLLGSSIPGANLFFLNPTGVMFGPHAQVSVDGSFTVSTASYLKLADGGRFDAAKPANDVLTSAPVAAFGFLNSNPGSITVDGSQLALGAGQKFSVAGGEVRIKNGARVSAPGGTVNVTSVSEAAEIKDPPDLAAITQGGTVEISETASIDVSGEGGGRVVIRAGKLIIDNAAILAKTTGDKDGMGVDIGVRGELTMRNSASIRADSAKQASGRAGSVSVEAGEQIQLSDGGQISADTYGPGEGGNVDLKAGSLTSSAPESYLPENSSLITSSSRNSDHGGDAGDVKVEVQGQLQIMEGGRISSDTQGAGKAGRVDVKAGSLVIDGQSLKSGIFSESNGTSQGGDAGTVNVEVVGQMQVLNWGKVSSVTEGPGKGGAVTVKAGSLVIDSQGIQRDFFGGISTESHSTYSGGNAGPVHVEVGADLQVLNAGQISSTTYGPGKGGSVYVKAGSLTLSAPNSFGARYSSISTSSREYDRAGDAGDVTVDVPGQLRIMDGGEISSKTDGSGKGGSVTVKAGSMLMDGHASIITFGGVIFHNGAAGDINVDVQGSVQILNSGGIGALTSDSVNGVKVRVSAGSLVIEGPANVTGIDAGTHGFSSVENKGGVEVTVRGEIQILGQGYIGSGGGLGNLWPLTVKAGSLLVDHGGLSAGDISITTTGSLTVQNGGAISAYAPSDGTGGNIFIDAGGEMRMQNATMFSWPGDRLFSFAPSGTISINAGGALTIQATSDALSPSISVSSLGPGTPGNVSIRAPSIRMSGFGASIDSGPSPPRIVGIDPPPPGRGGAIAIETGRLELSNGAQIRATTTGRDDAGAISINADAVLVSGYEQVPFPFIGTVHSTIEANSTQSASGKGGTVNITANHLEITDGGKVQTTTTGSGDAGGIMIKGKTVVVAGAGSKISAASEATVDWSSGTVFRPTGRVGEVFIQAGNLQITGGGTIRTDTQGSADSGHLTVKADTILVSGSGSTILAGTSVGTGNGGDVSLETRRLEIRDAGSVTASSVGPGDAGNISIKAGTIALDQRGSIQCTADTSGRAGSISLNVKNSLSLTGDSSVLVSAFQQDGGNIKLSAGSGISLLHSTISAQANVDGGDIHLMAPELVYLLNGHIIASAGRDGGNVVIDPTFVVLNHSDVTANAVVGNGGKINVSTDFFLNSASSLTASSEFGLQGSVEITALNVDLAGNLVQLTGSLLGAETRLPERCAVRLPGDFSSFVVSGRGGLPLEPGDWQPSVLLIEAGTKNARIGPDAPQ